ncbi:MAG TPA: DNA-3-methyladenine glycosylase [Terriglobales bacterium]|nr:DNA-3-methyladenine glycosylase [Terriglobales bacterium]
MRSAVPHLKAADPVLAGIIEQVGPYRPRHATPDFENLARSIAYQQLHGKAAATIFGRLLSACDACLKPETVLKLSIEQMRACGLSKQKLSYIRDLAEKTISGDVNFAQLPSMDDEDVIEHLTRVKGIGRWSAQMFLMFALKRPDVMPTVDLGINMAIKRAYRKRKVPKPAQILKIAEPWRPYRSVACWYLWRSMDVKTQED